MCGSGITGERRRVASTPQRIIELAKRRPGLTDRESTDELLGPGTYQQAVTQACRSQAARGRLVMRRRADGRIGNYPPGQGEPIDAEVQTRRSVKAPDRALGEDAIKEVVDR